MFLLKMCVKRQHPEMAKNHRFRPNSSRKTVTSSTPFPITWINNTKKLDVNDFDFVKVLGKGSFGKILLGERKSNKKLYAVKVLNKRDISVEYALTERRILILATRYPFLTALHSCFQTADRLFFVMEFVSGGDLSFHLQQGDKFDEERSAFYAAEITLALQFLHRHGFIHRDLKLDNVLLDQNGHCKVADFGLSKRYVSSGGLTNSFCGTLQYMAPEMIQKLDYNQSVDWWALGMITYEMLVSYAPFDCERTESQIRDSIVHDRVTYPDWLSRQAVSFISEKNPTHRLACWGNNSNIQRHEFFRNIDWESLEQRRGTPPFKPSIDTTSFNKPSNVNLLTPIPHRLKITKALDAFGGFEYFENID